MVVQLITKHVKFHYGRLGSDSAEKENKGEEEAGKSWGERLTFRLGTWRGLLEPATCDL